MNNQPNTELMKLNSHFLMIAQKQLTLDPISAKINLGLDDTTAEFISQLSPLEMHTLAESGISTIKFRFEEESIRHLKNFINGDSLAMTQAILGQGN